MEHETSTGQDLRRLNEIPRVGPEAGMITGNGNITALAGESGKPLDLFPAGGGILARMRIGAGQHDCIPALFLHKSAQLSQSFEIKVHGVIALPRNYLILMQSQTISPIISSETKKWSSGI